MISQYARALRNDWLVLASVTALVLIAGCAVFADIIAVHDPAAQALSDRSLAPFSGARDADGQLYMFGTDPLGRDIFSRLLHGARVSLMVGVVAVSVSATIGVTLGMLAGFFGGKLESVIMRIVDLQMAIPFLLLGLFILFAFGPGLFNLILVLAFARWPLHARVARSLALALKDSEYVSASRVLGSSRVRVILKHILPNSLSPLVVLATLEMARMILAEATLSFLGMGVQSPQPSWGLMIARGRDVLGSAPWNVYIPGVAIFVTALSVTLVATWLRVMTDPVQRWRWASAKGKRVSSRAVPELPTD